jgi:dTDP-4-amino-4,6-dideoxygalactose transaminase
MLQLKHINGAISRRRAIDALYRESLVGMTGITYFDRRSDTTENFSYFPIFINSDYPISRDALYQNLKENNIYARRYFYPLISDFPMYRGLPSANKKNLSVATDTALKVLCLPIYPDLTSIDIEKIVSIIKHGGR